MTRRRFTNFSLALTVACALFIVTPASADVIYIGDEAGNVAAFDTVSNTGAFLGNLSGFNVGQILGLAYDPATNAVLLLDRFSDAGSSVYTMDATSGAAALLFDTGSGFQGGAVANNKLYGVEENTQTLSSRTLPGGASVDSGGGLTSHTHSMGVDPATGQLYTLQGDSNIYTVNANATVGALVLTTSGILEFVDDMDYFGGDFLATQYGNDVLMRIDGTTGVASVFLTAAQLDAMGLTSAITGVTVAAPAAPEPMTLTLMTLGAGFAAARRLRRRRN